MTPLAHPARRRRGSIAVVVVILMTALGAITLASLLYSRSSLVVSLAVDHMREVSISRQALERLTAEAILSEVEVVAGEDPRTLEEILQGMLNNLNTASSGISYALADFPTSLATHRQYPDPARPLITEPNLATDGARFQIKSLLQGGAVKIGGPYIVDYDRISATTPDENLSIRVGIDLWSVPLTNWSVIAYGQPARVPGTGVPYAAPAGPTGSRPLVLTTLRPSPAFTPGDPTAFTHLYSEPESGGPETLPAYYRSHVSLAWNVWEYLWSLHVPNLLSPGVADYVFDFALPYEEDIPGIIADPLMVPLDPMDPETEWVAVEPDEATVDLATIEGETLVLVDSLGGKEITLVGAPASSTPLVIAIINTADTPTNIILSGNNLRTVMLYVMNGAVTASAVDWTGAIAADEKTSFAGSMTLSGSFAYAATNAPWDTFTLTMGDPLPQVRADLQDIGPRALLVSGSSAVLAP